MLLDERRDLGDLRLAADERGHLRRQVVREVFERTQRREIGDQIGCEQLVDAFGLREILEPVLAEIAQAALRRQLTLPISSVQAPERSTWPPWPTASRRATRLTVGPK